MTALYLASSIALPTRQNDMLNAIDFLLYKSTLQQNLFQYLFKVNVYS